MMVARLPIKSGAAVEYAEICHSADEWGGLCASDIPDWATKTENIPSSVFFM